MGNRNPHFLNGTDNLCRRGCTGCHRLHLVINSGFCRLWHIQQSVEHNWRTAHVSHLMIANQLEDFLRVHPP